MLVEHNIGFCWAAFGFLWLFFLNGALAVSHVTFGKDGSIRYSLDSPFSLQESDDIFAFVSQELTVKTSQQVKRTDIRHDLESDDGNDNVDENVMLTNKHCLLVGGGGDAGQSNKLDVFNLYDAMYIPLSAFNNDDDHDSIMYPSIINKTGPPAPDCLQFPLDYTSLPLLNDILKTATNNMEILHNNSILYEMLLTNGGGETLEDFAYRVKTLLDANPHSWLPYNYAALYYRMLGSATPAMECARRAAHLAPTDELRIVSYLNMASILHLSYKLEEAFSVLQHVLTKTGLAQNPEKLDDTSTQNENDINFPGAEYILYEFGLVQVCRGNYTDALWAFRRAQQLQQHLPVTFFDEKINVVECQHAMESALTARKNRYEQRADSFLLYKSLKSTSAVLDSEILDRKLSTRQQLYDNTQQFRKYFPLHTTSTCYPQEAADSSHHHHHHQQNNNKQSLPSPHQHNLGAKCVSGTYGQYPFNVWSDCDPNTHLSANDVRTERLHILLDQRKQLAAGPSTPQWFQLNEVAITSSSANTESVFAVNLTRRNYCLEPVPLQALHAPPLDLPYYDQNWPSEAECAALSDGFMLPEELSLSSAMIPLEHFWQKNISFWSHLFAGGGGRGAGGGGFHSKAYEIYPQSIEQIYTVKELQDLAAGRVTLEQLALISGYEAEKTSHFSETFKAVSHKDRTFDRNYFRAQTFAVHHVPALADAGDDSDEENFSASSMLRFEIPRPCGDLDHTEQQELLQEAAPSEQELEAMNEDELDDFCKAYDNDQDDVAATTVFNKDTRMAFLLVEQLVKSTYAPGQHGTNDGVDENEKEKTSNLFKDESLLYDQSITSFHKWPIFLHEQGLLNDSYLSEQELKERYLPHIAADMLGDFVSKEWRVQATTGGESQQCGYSTMAALYWRIKGNVYNAFQCIKNSFLQCHKHDATAISLANLAGLLLRIGQPKTAGEFIEQALQQAPHEPALRYLRGVYLTRMPGFEQVAENEFFQALAQDSSYWQAYEALRKLRCTRFVKWRRIPAKKQRDAASVTSKSSKKSVKKQSSGAAKLTPAHMEANEEQQPSVSVKSVTLHHQGASTARGGSSSRFPMTQSNRDLDYGVHNDELRQEFWTQRGAMESFIFEGGLTNFMSNKFHHIQITT